MAAKEKENKKEQESGIIRVSRQTKERLDSSRHPGQSYDGFLEEVLDYWEDTHPKQTRKLPVQPPAAPAKSDKESNRASEWWWPASDSQGGKK